LWNGEKTQEKGRPVVVSCDFVVFAVKLRNLFRISKLISIFQEREELDGKSFYSDFFTTHF
jgi:hypothetical protein